MILDLHRQGLSVSAIARQSGIDRKTVRKYIERGLEAPVYGPRQPRETVIDPFTAYLRERVTRYPGLTSKRLFRELKELGYGGGYTAVTDFLRDVRRPRRNAATRSASRPRPASRRRSTSPAFTSSSPTSQRRRGSCGCFPSCSASAASSGRASSSIRIFRRFCAAMRAPSRRWAAFPARCSIIG